jgi:hypothetical protein
MKPETHSQTVVLVGNPGPEHVGAHLYRGLQSAGLNGILVDAAAAYRANKWVARWNWRFRDRRPTRLESFSADVERECGSRRNVCLITTGVAPVTAAALGRLGAAGAARLNFLTDDPLNPAHRASWFLEALSQYDVVFSPRRQNMDDLRAIGCRRVEYLPFAYCPEVHFPEAGEVPFENDVLFAGGADADRMPWVTALIRAGMRLALYGGYWDRNSETAPFARGIVDLATLRHAVASSRISLCLVRRANRDGHAMRSFEVPAMGGCMLTEDTPEHRELFGAEGQSVLYFANPGEMVEKARWLLDHEEERKRLARAVTDRITNGRNTYQDRLERMMSFASQEVAH